jgi:hypothetical protein
MKPDTTPPDHAIRRALEQATRSPCRSQRGVAVYDRESGGVVGVGHNGPPGALGCPGRSICAGTCGQRSVHAESRALRDAIAWWPPCRKIATTHRERDTTLRHVWTSGYDLVHVELAAGGDVSACDGPSCWQCSREILDVGFVDGVWLYEEFERAAGLVTPYAPRSMPPGVWRRYTAQEFYDVTLTACRI